MYRKYSFSMYVQKKQYINILEILVYVYIYKLILYIAFNAT